MKLGWQIHDVGGSLPLLDAGFDGGHFVQGKEDEGG